MEKVLDRLISVDPNICHGRPHLEGHRIRVQDIAVWHERLGMSVDEISADYDLSLAQVYAALAYYFDHKDEIDRDIEIDNRNFNVFRANTPSSRTAGPKS